MSGDLHEGSYLFDAGLYCGVGSRGLSAEGREYEAEKATGSAQENCMSLVNTQEIICALEVSQKSGCVVEL